MSKDRGDQHRLVCGRLRQGIGARKLLGGDHHHPTPLERRVILNGDQAAMRTAGAYRASDPDAITWHVVNVLGFARDLCQAVALVDRLAEGGVHPVVPYLLKCSAQNNTANNLLASCSLTGSAPVPH